MHIIIRARCSLFRLAGISVMALFASACGLQEQTAPDPIGPAEFGLSVTLTATPDRLLRDGVSRSVVSVMVRDAQGGPVSGQRLHVVFAAPTVPNAQLTTSEVTTGSDGRATFAVIAPPSSTSGDTLTVSVTPVSNNFETAIDRLIVIGLTPSNPAAPAAAFTFTPRSSTPGGADAVANETVRFDASGSTDSGVACEDTCSYSWDFGDGTSGTGMIVSHAYSTIGTKTVTLTVRDPGGAAGTARGSVVVGAPTAPTVTLAVAPDPPVVNQQATFTATVTPVAGRSIARYEWDFGDGTRLSTAGPTVTKVYQDALVRVVSVTVTDDVGQVGNASLRVAPTFGSTVPAAVLSVSPSDPQPPGTTFNADASGSTVGAGATITEYTFVWGDGSANTVTSLPQASHTYFALGTYEIRLIVKDSVGRTATTTGTVTVGVTEPVAAPAKFGSSSTTPSGTWRSPQGR